MSGRTPVSAAPRPPRSPQPHRKPGRGMPRPGLPSPPASGITTHRDSAYDRRKPRSQVNAGRIVECAGRDEFFDAPRHERTRSFLHQILH